MWMAPAVQGGAAVDGCVRLRSYVRPVVCGRASAGPDGNPYPDNRHRTGLLLRDWTNITAHCDAAGGRSPQQERYPIKVGAGVEANSMTFVFMVSGSILRAAPE